VVIVEKGEVDTLVDELADAVRRWTGNRGHVQGLTVDEHARLLDEAPPLIEGWKRDLQPILGTRRSLVGKGATT